jgi:CheY-like chemotaxis protein
MTRTILLIDDDDDIREIAQLSLELGADWKVLTASSGAEGVLLAHEQRPDAILLDVMMPGMDGPATLITLRADEYTRAIPVVFLTAKAGATEHDRMTELAVAGILSKPFDPITLADQIRTMLGWSA